MHAQWPMLLCKFGGRPRCYDLLPRLSALHRTEVTYTARICITLSPAFYPFFSCLVVNEKVVNDSAPQHLTEVHDALQASMRNS